MNAVEGNITELLSGSLINLHLLLHTMYHLLSNCHYAKINAYMYQYGFISLPLVLNKWFVYYDGEYFFIVENGIVHMLKFDIQTI